VVRYLHPLINRKRAHGWDYPACSSYNRNIPFASCPLINKRRMPVYHDGGTGSEAFRGNDKAFHLAMCGFRFSFKPYSKAQTKLTKRIFELVKYEVTVMKPNSIVFWYRVLRTYHRWTMFEAIRFALWLAR
jgi:hypothetical protein